MTSIVIADGEYDVINNFKNFIKKNFNELRVDYIAMNFTELRSIIGNKNPDIVVSDIKILGPSPVQRMKDFNFYHPNIKFILYGTFNDSDYMKKCMEYGVVSYMFRPVKPSEFERCLDDAVKSIQNDEIKAKKRQELIKSYKGQLLLFEEKFLNSLVNGFILNEAEILNNFDYFGFNLVAPYTVAILRLDNYKKIVMSLDEEEKNMLIFDITNKINEKIKFIGNGQAFSAKFNEATLIIGGTDNLDDIIDILTEIKNTLKDDINLPISIGVGKSYLNASSISISNNEANEALRYRCIVGYDSIISIHHVEPNNKITYKYPIEREKLLVYTAVIGEYDYCIRLVNETFNSLKDCENIPKNLMSQIVMDILISINRHALEQELNILSVNNFFSTKEVLELETVEQAKEFLSNGLKKFCSYIIDFRKNEEMKLLEKAKEYVNEHYFESINAEKTARDLNCSFEYLKKIFRDNLDKTFSEYLNKIRINNAKKIILDTELDDAAVAVNVGFDDAVSFRAVFKQCEGYTLSDFRFIKSRQKMK